MSRYHFIERHCTQVPVRTLCRVLQVAPSSYYAWRKRRQQPAPAWERAIVRAFQRHARRYGTRRLRAEVHAEGHRVGRGRIRRVLAAHGLRAQQPRSFVPRTTDSGHGRRVAPNRLRGQPRPTAPNRVWVGDITCLPKQGGGWLYLASWQDACSRKVVGWDVRETMPEDLVSEALRRALVVRQPPAGLIVHSDQGSQYTATRFRDLLAAHGATQSMSRRGNCYDNAQAESFWSRLKTELLNGGSFPGLEEARLELSHYIAYYNAERRHSALAYHSPNHFENQLQLMSEKCSA
ncbi:IS3 family transposase [Hymenobacter defluvii]|uniref:IS3 family transposase n=1 Tax=Hymenobacter defluvii TaxID=2054411 RepID=A0ABS3TET6_9BACT|nr:IS3 family transposase [Hymenobacter defluvii]